MVIEEQIDFAKGAVFGLREAEPTPDKAEEVRASIEKTSFGTPIPSYEMSVNVEKS